MSKRETQIRQRLIVKKLEQWKQATLDEIMDYLSRESEIQGYNFNVSTRTFQRDIRDISLVHGIFIAYNRSNKTYFIEENDEPELNERLFEAFDVYNALRISEQNKQHIFLENRQAKGTEHMLGLLHAIKKQVQISITYQTFRHDNSTQRKLEPLALKEFKHRWYLFARDAHDHQIKTYGLDRMLDLQILKTKFPNDPTFNLKDLMKYCFGITVPKNEKPCKVVLSFDPFQGKYIKSLPLHDTQKLIVDNAKECRISLNVYLTYDFKMELLSLGETVKVLEPKRLIKEMNLTYQTALKQY